MFGLSSYYFETIPFYHKYFKKVKDTVTFVSKSQLILKIEQIEELTAGTAV